MKSIFSQVGDRPFTDVVFGNRNGLLTILTEPLSIVGETFVVRQVGFSFYLSIYIYIPFCSLLLQFIEGINELKI